MSIPQHDPTVRKAEAAYQAGNFQQSADLYEQAVAWLTASGDPIAAAEMSNNASVAALRAGDAARALRCTEGTPLVFEQAADFNREAIALGNQAAAHEALGHLDQAADLYQRSADLMKQGYSDPELRATVLKSLSALQMRTGKQLQAMATMQAALDSQKRLTLRERILNKLLKVPFRMLK